jgi:hypothetical protein
MAKFVYGKGGGHRDDYYHYFQHKLKLRCVKGLKQKILENENIIYTMLEDSVVECLLVALVRGLHRRNTTILVFRPFYSRLLSAAFVKLLILKIYDKLNLATIVPIIPKKAYNRSGFSFKNECLDPQFYDLDIVQEDVFYRSSDFLMNLHKNSEKYDILIVGLAENKGLSALIEFVNKNYERFNFTITGRRKFDIGVVDDRAQIKYIDRWLSIVELSELYRYTDFVWSCYDISYDQSSGVLGRAIQFGKSPIVRKDSVCENICRLISFPYFIVDSEYNLIFKGFGLNRQDVILKTKKYDLNLIINSLPNL